MNYFIKILNKRISLFIKGSEMSQAKNKDDLIVKIKI